MAGPPVGNTNAAKRNRMLTSALIRELVQNPEDAIAVAKRVIQDAKAGVASAQTLLFERVDGKVAQPVDGDGEGGPIQTIHEIIIRGIDANG